jgi:predicted type IV restriction endonuclease
MAAVSLRRDREPQSVDQIARHIGLRPADVEAWRRGKRPELAEWVRRALTEWEERERNAEGKRR